MTYFLVYTRGAYDCMVKPKFGFFLTLSRGKEIPKQLQLLLEPHRLCRGMLTVLVAHRPSMQESWYGHNGLILFED